MVEKNCPGIISRDSSMKVLNLDLVRIFADVISVKPFKARIESV